MIPQIRPIDISVVGFALKLNHFQCSFGQFRGWFYPNFSSITECDQHGSIQWPCNESTVETGTSLMHSDTMSLIVVS